MEVTPTHWSATFGSRESVSVGVSGKEEPDSCIWHNSSSVMMSNMVSSGNLKSVFVPGPQGHIRREEKNTRYAQDGESLKEGGSAATQDEPPGHTVSAHPTDCILSRCVRKGCWDTSEEQSEDYRWNGMHNWGDFS